MNQKSTLAGVTGLVFFLGCGGSAHKLGGDTQANESSGGSVGSPATGGVAGNTGEVGGHGGDPFAVADAGYAGGQVGGYVGIGGSAGYETGGVTGVAGGYPTTGGVTGVAGGAQGGVPGIGGQTVGTGGQTQPQPAGPQGAPGIAVIGGADSGPPGADFIRTWTGYVENGRFSSGSDALLLSIERASNTELGGHLVMGQGSGTLPDPQDLAGFGGSPGYEPLEGYSYTAMNGKATGQRLEFDVAFNEVWNSACAAMTPVPGRYSCLPPADSYGGTPGSCFMMHGQDQEPLDCAVLGLCTGPCKCDDTHCFADLAMYVAHFDMTLRQPYLDGSATGVVFMPNNVHFSPQ